VCVVFWDDVSGEQLIDSYDDNELEATASRIYVIRVPYLDCVMYS
jgi:hypothetical protein